MAENSPDGHKTLWDKEKLLMSNFSFSRSVFKRLVLQTRKNQGLFRKGLQLQMNPTENSIQAIRSKYLQINDCFCLQSLNKADSADQRSGCTFYAA